MTLKNSKSWFLSEPNRPRKETKLSLIMNITYEKFRISG